MLAASATSPVASGIRRLAAIAVVVVAWLIAAAVSAGPARALPADATRPTADAPCFGAAAWDHARPCHNPALALVVEPAPADAERAPNAPCDGLEEAGLVRACLFGVPADRARGTIALVGDSHASHWRAALDTVARSNAWAGISLARTSCPLSMATRNLPEPQRTQCSEWNRQVMDWFGAHPEVTTVFTGELSGGKGVVVRPGQDRFKARVDGYLRAWRALPPTVRRIVVIRDTPKARRHGDMAGCVSRAMSRRRPAGPACSVRRRQSLDPDPAVVAARRLRSRSAQVLDMTDFFCRQGRCPPVIGGALVYKDANHLTRVYVSTLGPIVQRRVDGLLADRR